MQILSRNELASMPGLRDVVPVILAEKDLSAAILDETASLAKTNQVLNVNTVLTVFQS